MKKIKFCLIALLFASSSAAAFSQSENEEKINRVSIRTGYNAILPHSCGESAYEIGINGAFLGASYLLPFNNEETIGFEPGLEYCFAYGKQDDTKIRTFDMTVPLNLAYIGKIGNVVIKPYCGIYGRVNIYSNTKRLYEDPYGDLWEGNFNNFRSSHTFWFDEKRWKRFQLGYQVGINMICKNIIEFGVGYSRDWMEISGGVRQERISATIGVRF